MQRLYNLAVVNLMLNNHLVERLRMATFYHGYHHLSVHLYYFALERPLLVRSTP